MEVTTLDVSSYSFPLIVRTVSKIGIVKYQKLNHGGLAFVGYDNTNHPNHFVSNRDIMSVLVEFKDENNPIGTFEIICTTPKNLEEIADSPKLVPDFIKSLLLDEDHVIFKNLLDIGGYSFTFDTAVRVIMEVTKDGIHYGTVREE